MAATINEPGKHELKIGLTGGVASGKSTVADLFADYGIPVIDTDIIAREVVKPGQPGLEAIVESFGTEILTADRQLDRRKLRDLVFADNNLRQALEAILHPLIRSRTQAWADQAGGPYQVLVVPLLVETGFGTLVDRVLVVDCPENQQRTRLLARDNETPQRVEQMLAAQANRAERLAIADDIIDNSKTLAHTSSQVAEQHAAYLRLALTR